MIDLIKEHWFISILGTIFLGALGSGVWEAALKPTFQYIGKYAFTILSFGAKKASDNIYIDAARGHHEVPSLYVFFNITLFLICTLFALQTLLVKTVYLDDFEVNEISECVKIEDQSEKDNCIKNHLRKKVTSQLPYLILISVFIAVMLFYRFIVVNRVNLTITYFYQCLRICSPYLSKEESLLLEQKFSLMKEKSNFDEIINELKLVADNNDIKLPRTYI